MSEAVQYKDCEHCGSPRKGVQCRYWWWSPNREAAKAGGWDPPCMCDEYDARMEQLHRRRVRRWILGYVLAGLFILAGGWLLFH